jgi:hypothetical protein
MLTGEGTVGSAMVRQGIEPFEIGRDSISPVSPDYKSKGSFPFTGTIEEIQFDATPLTPEKRGELEQLRTDFALRMHRRGSIDRTSKAFGLRPFGEERHAWVTNLTESHYNHLFSTG